LCKHALALVSFLHYKSREPSCTEVECYWRPSVLSTVADLRVPITNFNKKQETLRLISDYNSDGRFLANVKQRLIDENLDCMLYRQITKVGKHRLCMNRLSGIFSTSDLDKTAAMFLNFATCEYDEPLVSDIALKTVLQSDCPLWHTLRYGRITASILNSAGSHEAEGTSETLVNYIFGAANVDETFAMRRGLDLEEPVRKRFAEMMACKISPGHLQMSADHPHMAASPDGVSDNFVVEIKSPMENRNAV
jgi:hypothetical protein